MAFIHIHCLTGASRAWYVWLYIEVSLYQPEPLLCRLVSLPLARLVKWHHEIC